MEMTIEDQKRQKEILVEMFRFFVAFCKKHSLMYYCGYGTTIGAMRHHGFIPWDDDIDVVMPRPDYDRLMTLANAPDLEDYEIVDCSRRDDVPTIFAKLSHKSSTIFENQFIPSVLGVYIDIFPLDGVSENRELFQQRYDEMQVLKRSLFEVSTRFTPFKLAKLLLIGQWQRVSRIIGLYHNREKKRKEILQRFDTICQEIPYEKASHVAVYGGFYGYRECMKREWFDKGEIVNFEGIKVRVPSCWDKYLTSLYSDWRKLPPENKRVSHHSFAFYDLSRRYELTEIKEKI